MTDDSNVDLPAIRLGIVCDCGDGNHDHADALLGEVYERLGRATANFRARTITPANFTSEVIRSLLWDLNVTIKGIPCDQWFGIRAEFLAEHGEQDVFIQCDKVEHGLAALWKRFADRQGLSVADGNN